MVYVAATKLAIHLTAELALTAGLAIAKKIASTRASHGIENGSDPALMSSSTKEMPEEIDIDDIQTQSSSGVQESTDDFFPDSDDNKVNDYSERVQIDVQIPSHSYSNDHSSYQYHIHINNKLGKGFYEILTMTKLTFCLKSSKSNHAPIF